MSIGDTGCHNFVKPGRKNRKIKVFWLYLEDHCCFS